MARTATQRLADILLDQPVESYVAAKRAEGRSWRLIARDIYVATDSQIDVTTQTLRQWMAAAEAEAVA